VVALVAHEDEDVDTDLGVVRLAQTLSGNPQDFGRARTTLQEHAQYEGIARRCVIDHVAHPSQDHQARRFRVTRNRRLQWLAFDLEKTDGLARRIYARS